MPLACPAVCNFLPNRPVLARGHGTTSALRSLPAHMVCVQPASHGTNCTRPSPRSGRDRRRHRPGGLRSAGDRALASHRATGSTHHTGGREPPTAAEQAPPVEQEYAVAASQETTKVTAPARHPGIGRLPADRPASPARSVATIEPVDIETVAARRPSRSRPLRRRKTPVFGMPTVILRIARHQCRTDRLANRDCTLATANGCALCGHQAASQYSSGLRFPTSPHAEKLKMACPCWSSRALSGTRLAGPRRCPDCVSRFETRAASRFTHGSRNPPAASSQPARCCHSDHGSPRRLPKPTTCWCAS